MLMDPWTSGLTMLNASGGFGPAWAPAGDRIAFARSRESHLDPGVLYIIGLGGSMPVNLAPAGVIELADPAWSPDGKRMAFTSGAEIVLMTLEDGSVTPLTAGADPAWSPDGTRLVFAGADGLFTINAGGSNRTRLTTGRHSSPTWRR